MEYFTEVRWSPYVVGIGIGVLSWLSFFISNKPLACSTTFVRVSGLFERLLRGPQVEKRPYYQKIKLTWGWQGMLVTGIVPGFALCAALR